MKLTADDLAADIRRIDGNHDMGAGKLAEALFAAGWGHIAARSPQPAKTYTFDEILDGRGPEHRTKVEKRFQELLSDYNSQEPVNSSQPAKPAGAVPMPVMEILDRREVTPLCDHIVMGYTEAQMIAYSNAREATAGGVTLIDPAELLSAYVRRCIGHHDDAPREYRVEAMREALEELGAKPAPIPQQPTAGGVPHIEFTLHEATRLFSFFGGNNSRVTVELHPDRIDDDRMHFAGLYAYCTEYPEEGAEYLGPVQVQVSAAIPQQPTAEGTCSRRCSETSECDGSCAPVAVTAEPAVEATGTVNGYLQNARAVEIIMDGSVPRWISDINTRVTISPTGGKSDA